jgi:hypothetical protein
VPTQKRDYSKILIVEGADDKHSVIGLMKSHTNWPEKRTGWPVWIEVGNSVDQILEPGYLTTEIKASNARIIGVMLDADTQARGRYQRIQQLCATLFPDLPAHISPGGLITDNGDDKRFGLWLMPDNTGEGALETFLRYLVPSQKEALWKRACGCVVDAISAGAECRGSHVPKASLYTWLAWQDPPGQSPGLALTRKILDPDSEYAEPFVDWFKRLYRL